MLVKILNPPPVLIKNFKNIEPRIINNLKNLHPGSNIFKLKRYQFNIILF